MLETYFTNINTFKLYFFLFSSSILFFPYLLYGVKSLKINTFILFSMFFIILLHSMSLSFDVEHSTEKTLYALSILVTFYFVIKTFGSNFIFTYYKKIIIFFTAIILFSSDFILIFLNIPSYYVDGNFIGITQNSNTLGLYLSVFIAPVILHFFFYSESRIKTIFLSLVILNISYILYLTKSRTALVIFVLISIYFYLFYNPKLKSKLKGLSFITLIFLATIITFNEKISDLIYKKDKTSLTSTRDKLWNARLDAIEQKPYLGWGYQINEFYYVDDYHIYNKLEKGNTVLAILEEFGLIIGFIILIILSYLFFQVIQTIKILNNYYFINITIVATLLHSLLETWLFNFNGVLTMFFWLLIMSSLEIDKEKYVNAN